MNGPIEGYPSLGLERWSIDFGWWKKESGARWRWRMRGCLWVEWMRSTLVRMQRWGWARSGTCAVVDSCLFVETVMILAVLLAEPIGKTSTSEKESKEWPR
jgi:hypothetical protein